MSTTNAIPSITSSSTLFPLETNFLTVATAANKRGFAVTPVHPQEKRGVFWGQYTHPAKNISEITQFSKDYPGHNVGIVSRRGVGNLAFLDIDADGVVEQIERDTRCQLPLTYTVQSRPQSAPFKKHFYFRQTEYSFNAFGRNKSKEINVKDLSVDGKQPTLFDLKGIGGGGLVVAAGSIRESGEIYTDNGEVAVAPFPNWLVDWVLKVRDRYRSDAARLRERVKAEMATAVQAKQAGGSLAPKDSIATAAQAGQTKQASGSLVPKDHIRTVIKSRVGIFASLGVRRKTIERLIKEQIEDLVEDGVSLAGEYKDFIHTEAVNPKLRIGRLRTEFLPLLPPRNIVTASPSGGIVIELALRRHEVMSEAIRAFPSRLKTSEVRARMAEPLAKRGFTQAHTKAEDRAVARAMRGAGFRVVGCAGNERVWSKEQQV